MQDLLIADTNSKPVLSEKTWEELKLRKRFVNKKSRPQINLVNIPTLSI